MRKSNHKQQLLVHGLLHDKRGQKVLQIKTYRGKVRALLQHLSSILHGQMVDSGQDLEAVLMSAGYALQNAGASVNGKATKLDWHADE